MHRVRMAVAGVALVVTATACGGVTSTVFFEVGEPTVALPPACEAEIGDFLVAIEPVVLNVDFETASEEDISSLGGAMAAAGDGFDPEVCPELDVEESRTAWLAIAEERAPGTRSYIEYTYSTD